MTTLQVAKQTDPGRVRENNEDAILEHHFSHAGTDYRLLAVADGMGGGPAGEVASRMAIETLQASLEGGQWDDEKEGLGAAFQRANAVVFDIGSNHGAQPSSPMGSTLVAALVNEATADVWVANVGDSRCYLLTRDGLEQVTEDHSALAELRRMNGGHTNASHLRNVITRAIGPESQVVVDLFGPRRLQPGERLLLCSDGLTNMVRDSEIRGLLANPSIGHAVGDLVTRANQHGGKDNVSLVVSGVGMLTDAPEVSRHRRMLAMCAIGAGLVSAVVVVAVIATGLTARGGTAPPPTEMASTTVQSPPHVPPPLVDQSWLPAGPNMALLPRPSCSAISMVSVACLHTVVSGDYCSTLDQRFQLPADTIEIANEIACMNLLSPGEILIIPLGDAE